LYIANSGTPWLSIAGAVYLFPYFLIGLFFSRFPATPEPRKIIGYALLTVIVLFLLFYGQEYGGARRSLNALVIGSFSCIALLMTEFESKLLARIGFYSYSIYLFHVFFTAASRIVFTKFGISNIWLLFVFGTLLGLAGPIIFEIIASKADFTRIYFLGKRPKTA
jgi:peptidoglycan/LPS O-acetylase OafA/YrhL